MSKKFGKIAVEKGLITAKELELVLKEQSKKRNAGESEETTLIGYLLCETGSIDESEVKAILNSQYTQRERYHYVDTLGAGGMGVVQLVQDNLLGRQVALKKIRSRKEHTTKLSNRERVMLWRLEQEASITAILEHPHIVPLYDMQEKEDGELQFTMRKVEGETFRSILNKKKAGELSYDEDKLLSIFFKICDAVAYAHSKEIIHRDLKPDNIMIGEFGEVYVMDWGIAKQGNLVSEQQAVESSSTDKAITEIKSFSNETKGTTLEPAKTLQALTEIEEFYKTVGGLGTEGYMSPEQREDASKVTRQSDIYALGKILKECYLLLSPIEEFQAQMKFNSLKLENSSFKNKSPFEEKIPLDIQAVVQKATMEAPTARYNSVEKMVSDIENYLKHTRVSVREYGFKELFQKWSKRNQKTIGIVSFFLIFVLSFLGYRDWEKKQEAKLQYLKKQQAIETDFKNKYQLAREIIEEATKREARSKQEKSEKVKHLLAGLNQLKSALEVKQNDKVQTEKQKLGKELVTLCCEIEDYTLASFIANDIKEMQDYVEKEQTKTLKQHQESLEEWIVKLQDAKAGMREDAVLEISKMQEKEIFAQLLKIQQKGLNYFLNNEKRTQKKDEFYQIMTEALGKLENPKAGASILIALQKIEQKLLSQKKEKKVSLEVLEYMVILGKALGNSKAYEFLREFREIRTNMGQNEIFWNRTQISYEKLLNLMPLENNVRSESEYILQGEQNMQKKDLAGAILAFSKAIKLNPKSYTPYLYLGNAKMAQGKYDQAIENYKKAIELKPDFGDLYINVASAKRAKQDFESAIENYNKALKLNPNSTLAYYNRSISKFAKKDYQEAIQDCNEALELNPQYSNAYVLRGRIKERIEDFNGALEDYNQTIQLDHDSVDALNNRGNIKYQMGNLQSALEDYNRVAYLNPQSENVYNNRGKIKEELGDIEGAIRDYNEAIRLNPGLPQAYSSRAYAKGILGDFKGALEDHDRAIQADPKRDLSYINRGGTKANLKNFEGAIKDFSKAIELNPQNAMAWSNRGAAKAGKNDFESALVDFNEAIRLNPQDAEIYYNRGMVKFKQKDIKGAITDLDESISLNPQLSKAFFNRGSIKKNNKIKEAFRDYLSAFNLSPKLFTQKENSEILISLVIGLFKEKKFQEAQEILIRFKQHISPDHSKYKQVEQMLQQIEKAIQKEKKVEKKE